jgi:tripartite-type tricarboxylate transporter receptor subunit TctC
MKIIFAIISAFLMGSCAYAQAPTYPDGIVKMLVGYPAGQTTDMIARTIAERLADKWKSTVIVENIPGAGSTLAASVAARAKKDGQTILFTANAAMVIAPYIYDNLSYQPLKDFEFINLSIWVPYVCAVTPSLPVANIKSLVEYIKKNPDKVSYGSPGVGTISHLTMEMLKAEHQLNLLHVPYKGSAAALTDLAAGNVQFACEPPSVIAPLVKAGRIKPIAVTSEKRLSQFPDTPTIGETYPGFTSGAWVGVVVPKGVPTNVINKLDSDISAVLKDPVVIKKFEDAGLVVFSDGPEKFTKLVKFDDDRFSKLIRGMNLKQ